MVELMRRVRSLAVLVFVLSAFGLMPAARADPPAPFDLAGPSLAVSVTRQGQTLPIAMVPQLSAGDTISVAVNLPATETAHYLLVAAFLRDPTNPPPDAWFFRSETWKAKGRGGGALSLVVPEDARHLALFLAPATGGDFATLRKAVEARPGAFIRAAQDLEQASLDRSRFEAYLAAIRTVSGITAEALAHDAPVIAASLHIKINEDCLQRQAEFQAACLLDAKQAVVLSGDGSSQSALTGAATDLVMSLSNTPAGGAGYYSPYVGAIRDIVGIFGAMRSARYQYIPALGLAHDNTLSLVLNTPPSFADPKSVLMVALPGISPAQPQVPHQAPGVAAPCLGVLEPARPVQLPVTISPLWYATAFAHGLHMRVHLAGDGAADVPIVADPVRGGLIIAPGATLPKDLTGPVSATIHGTWGFDPFTGPQIALAVPAEWHWHRKDLGKEPGKEDGTLTLTGSASACVTTVTVAMAHGKPQPASWKAIGPDDIAVTLPTSEARHEQWVVSVVGPAGSSPATLTVAPPARPQPPAAHIAARFSDSPGTEPGTAAQIAVQLDSADEIPAAARLSFTLKAQPGEHFTGHEVVEVGTTGSDETVRLATGSGLTLVDPTVLVASLTPAQALGTSAYGPLRARLVRGDVDGDWMGIGTLVRLPRLKALDCATAHAGKCTLRGEALYLLASVAATREFDNAASVPDGYPGSSLTVMAPGADGTLYVRLHDAPEVINRVVIAAPK
jgi:hypothetical protein